jgi:hypothetical protein
MSIKTRPQSPSAVLIIWLCNGVCEFTVIVGTDALHEFSFSWKAPARLCQCYRTLRARGKHANQVLVASARAVLAFLWAIAREVPVTAETPHTSPLKHRGPLVAESRGNSLVHRLSAEAQPRCGATLDGVTR